VLFYRKSPFAFNMAAVSLRPLILIVHLHYRCGAYCGCEAARLAECREAGSGRRGLMARWRQCTVLVNGLVWRPLRTNRVIPVLAVPVGRANVRASDLPSRPLHFVMICSVIYQRNG
jgi:hypothetical protein